MTLLLPVFYVSAQFYFGQHYLKNPNRVVGYALQTQTWDQFGKKLILENRYTGRQIEKNLPPNGFFVFENLAPGNYRLWAEVKDGRWYVSDFNHAGQITNLKSLRYRTNLAIQDFRLVMLIPLLIGIFYFMFALMLFLKVRHENLGAIFLILSLPPFWVDSIDSLQNTLAYLGQEFWAGRLFYLKHYPLIFCACGFALFFLILSNSQRVLKATGQGRWLFLPGVFLTPFFASAFIFNSETLFIQLWGFEYSWLVKINIASVFLMVLGGSILLIRNYRKLSAVLQRQAKTVLVSSFIFWAAYLPVVLVPVIFFDSHEFFPGEFMLFSSVGVLFLFMSFAKAVFGDRLVAFEAVANRSGMYRTVMVLYASTFLILFLDSYAQFKNASWVWVFLVAAILLFYPLQKILFKFLDHLFAPPLKNTAQFLAEASHEIVGTLDRTKLIPKVKKILKKLNPQLESRVFLRTQLELREYQLENQIQKTVLKEEQEAWLLDGQVKKLDQPRIFDKFLPRGEFANYYLLPFLINARLEGWVLMALPASSHPFGVEDHHILSALQEQVSVGLLNARLYEELKQTYESYKNTQEKLHKMSRLSMMGELAAGFAHEIKNPLTSISSLIQALDQKLEDQEFRSEFSQIVPRQIEKIMDLIKKMLSYGQERDLEKNQVAIHEVCSRNIKLLNTHAVKFGVRIEMEVQHPLEIKTDATLWDEVFLNLMLNGIQAMPRGGVLRIVFSKQSDGHQIVIQDHGVGMPEDILSKIFQPLFTTRKTGTGMGLAIVERNLARLGAEVKVASQVGAGTVFTLTLPQAS